MGFVLYRSSAGSGKTYTLVKEYLEIVLENPARFKNILAVTFTNKAAGEMKDRIIQALHKLSLGKDRELETTLLQEIGGSVKIDIKERSSAILTHILHNYSDLAIMTIDSFIHKVIRAFALEIDLPLNFDVALNYERLESFVIEKLFALVGRDEFITAVILEFVFSRLQEEKNWDISGDILRFEKDILSEKNTDWVSRIGDLDNPGFNRMIAQLNDVRLAFIEKMNELGTRALNMIREKGLTVDDFAYKEKGAVGFLQKCSTLRTGEIKSFHISSRFLDGYWTTKSAPGDVKAAVENLLAGGLAEISAGIIEHYNQNRARALSASFALDNIYLAAIINRIKALIDDFKRKHNVIPISEFNIYVYEIIKKSPVPFIYSIIGEKYNHYLIDEFQDTSRLQWENLFPLIENALGYDFFNMAVGDGKQSIYRWRGGDVEILEKDIAARIHREQLAVKPLGRNFRSYKNIVSFNNRFFEKVAEFYRQQGEQENLLLERIYSDTAQQPVRQGEGFVSLQFIEAGGGGEEDINDSAEAGDLENNGDNEIGDTDEAVFQQVNRIIADCCAAGYDYSDIAILVRENREGRVTAENLLEHGIPVVSPDSLLLAQTPLVRFFINILTYLNNPADKIAEAAVIYFPVLADKREKQDASTIGDHFLANTHKDITPALAEFFRRRDYLIRMPVYEAIEEVCRIFALPGSLGFNAAGYLQAFLDVVSEYTAGNSVDFASFLEWWEFNKNDFCMIVPETKPAVKIMTIHKAKGLEFPVVIIPYANWGHSMDKQLWLTAQPPLPGVRADLALPVNTPRLLEETFFKETFREEKEKVTIDNINLLYVAFTRAEDRLYIIAEPKRRNDNYYLLKELAVPLLDKEITAGKEYPLGTPGGKEKKPGKEKTAPGINYRETDTFISNRWYDKISIRRKKPDSWGFARTRAEKRDWGDLVHQVLSRIRTIEDVPAVLEKAFISGDIAADEKEILAEKIAAIFEIETVREWFKPGQEIFNEAPMITGQGILRPDRVIISGNSALIIEFKTGAKSMGHVNQVLKYEKALQAMGYDRVAAYLFYLDDNEIRQAIGY